jgi:DNA-binding CsgD family transcriptional regulator
VDSEEEGPRALVLDGEAGIGKTTLWQVGVAAARQKPGWVLVARPVEAEAALGFAGLTDLFGLVPHEVFEELPEPRRHALEVALLRAPARRALNVRAVAAAVRDVLTALSVIGRVVVAIDDLQWLDASSAQALAFALRRLEEERVAMLATRRAGIEADVDVAAAVGDDCEHITVGPLGERQLHRLFRLHDVTLPLPIVRRVHEISGGNPFFALELGRGVAGNADAAALSVPPALSDLVRERVESLPRATRSALLVAAALSAPTVSHVRATESSPGRRDPLAAAVGARVVEIEGDRIRFTHPLLASVIYGAAPTASRRRLHRQLAAVVTDPEERAKHLALALEREDAATADVLEEAATRAHARGATADAAFFRERAAELTPRSMLDLRLRRLTDAAVNQAQSGNYERAGLLLERVVASAPSGVSRARGLHHFARARSTVLEPREWLALQDEARAHAQGDALLLAAIERGTVGYLIRLFDFDGAARHARASLTAAEAADDGVSLSAAYTGLAIAGFGLGHDGLDLLERAVELEPKEAEGRLWERPREILAGRLRDVDEFDRSRALYLETLAAAAEAGQEPARARMLTDFCLLECLVGDYRAAERHIGDAIEGGIEVRGHATKEALCMAGLVAAYFGQVELAREHVAAAATVSRVPIDPWCPSPEAVLGFLELSLGNGPAAVEHLTPIGARRAEAGTRDPAFLRFVPDAAEAFLTVGQATEALSELGRFEDSARKLGRASALAAAGRCRGLTAATSGDLDGAFASFAGAMNEHDRLPMPFERARTLLALGTVQRRAKQRQAARESLDEALSEFDRLGTPLWAGKARTELARIGGRRAERDMLTPAEDRIARLVAAGHTNREVAAQLFVTVKTVEGALSRSYVKLGLRSRSELTAYMLDKRGAPGGVSAAKE